MQIVYILDQVKALEAEIIARFTEAGLDVKPQIVVVTRLIPESQVRTFGSSGGLACEPWLLHCFMCRGVVSSHAAALQVHG